MWSKPWKRILQLGLTFNSDSRLLTEKMYDKESATNNSAGVIQTSTKCCYLWRLIDQTIDIGFLDFFNRLPKKSPATGTLRLFQRVNAGDTFYAAYGPDALFVAQNVFHTKSVVKYLGAGARRLESVTLKVSVAQTLLREALTSKQLRVEIYEPEGGQGKKSPNFELTKEVRVAALFGPLYYNDLFSLSLSLRLHLEIFKLLRTYSSWILTFFLLLSSCLFKLRAFLFRTLRQNQRTKPSESPLQIRVFAN